MFIARCVKSIVIAVLVASVAVYASQGVISVLGWILGGVPREGVRGLAGVFVCWLALSATIRICVTDPMAKGSQVARRMAIVLTAVVASILSAGFFAWRVGRQVDGDDIFMVLLASSFVVAGAWPWSPPENASPQKAG